MSATAPLASRARGWLDRGVRIVRMMTPVERPLLLCLLGILVVAVVDMLDAPSWPSVALAGSALIVLCMTVAVVADAIVMRQSSIRAHNAMIKLNTTKPTGAPRVVEVACIHGDHHRYVYGPHGWEAAGPAVERRPVSAAVRVAQGVDEEPTP